MVLSKFHTPFYCAHVDSIPSPAHSATRLARSENQLFILSYPIPIPGVTIYCVTGSIETAHPYMHSSKQDFKIVNSTAGRRRYLFLLLPLSCHSAYMIEPRDSLAGKPPPISKPTRLFRNPSKVQVQGQKLTNLNH